MNKITNLGVAFVAALLFTLTAPAAHAACDALMHVNAQHELTVACDGHVLRCYTRWSANLTPSDGIEFGFNCANGNTYSDSELHPDDDAMVPEGESVDRRAVISSALGQVLFATGDLGTGRLRFHTLEIFGRDYEQVYIETGEAEETPSQQILAWDMPSERFIPLFSDTSYVMQIHGDLAGVSMFVPTIDTCDRTWTWDPGNSRFRARVRRGEKPAACTVSE